MGTGRRRGRRFGMVWHLVWAACGVVAPPVAGWAATPVRVGTYQNRPLIYTGADGRAAGVFADLIDRVAAEEGWSVTYVPGSWEECLARLDRGEVDLLVAIAHTPQRASKYLFSDQTVFVNWAQVFVRDADEIESLLDLSGKRVAVVRGDIYNVGEGGIRDLARRFELNCRFVEVQEYADALRAVQDGQADAGVVNRLFDMTWEGHLHVARSPLVFCPTELRCALSRTRPDATALKAALDRRLAAWKRDPASVYHRALEQHMAVRHPGEADLPSWFLPAAGTAGALMALLAAAAGVLRWQVRARTAELRAAKESLEHDLERRKRAEDALRESQRRLSTLMSNLHGIVYRCRHDPQRTLEFVSDGCRDLTGYEPEDLVDSRRVQFADLILPADRPKAWQEVQDAVAARQPFTSAYRLRDAHGHVRWVQDLGRGVYADDGSLLALEGFIADITRQRQADEDRRKLETQVQHAQKLESLGVLAGGIAHDFNNILMAILGNADLALGALAPESPGRDSIDEIAAAARRAADLCRQMLAYSGRGRFVLERLDLSAIVDEIAHMLKVSISKKAVLRFNYVEHLPPVFGDATQLRQIVLNLVLNASEAIGERSGVISITTGAMECDRAYLKETYLDEDLPEGLYVYLEIADTGCGMDAATKARIFDPFFTTKFAGRGLGLAAVLGIVRSHRGAIKVYTEPGRGSTFKVLFPVADGAARPTEAKPAPAAAWTGKGTVLLVDDEETLRTLGKRMLEALGMSVLTAADGREAVALFRQHQADVSCVLLDLTMPHLNGLETFRELRRVRPDVRVILTSGYGEQEVAGQSAGKGVAGFLQKPYRLEGLAAKLREVLGG